MKKEAVLETERETCQVCDTNKEEALQRRKWLGKGDMQWLTYRNMSSYWYTSTIPCNEDLYPFSTETHATVRGLKIKVYVLILK